MTIILTTERAIKQAVFQIKKFTVSLTLLELLGTILCLFVSLSFSEAENLAMEMLSVVSACSKCFKMVYRSPVYGLKPSEIHMALWLLGILLERKSTSLDSSSSWFLSNRSGICAIHELRSRTNPTYLLLVSLRGFSIL